MIQLSFPLIERSELRTPTVDVCDTYMVQKVNIQDFLQVFQGSGIGKMEDNITVMNAENDSLKLVGKNCCKVLSSSMATQ